jgi:hypothetical protein
MRLAVAFAVVLLAVSAACTSLIGDFTLLTPSVDAGDLDSTARFDGSQEDAPFAVVEASVATPPTVYVGQAVQLDAGASTTTFGILSFSWEMFSPAGSQLTTESLQCQRSYPTSRVRTR